MPCVHGREGAWLVLDRVAEGRPGPEAARRFGSELAGLHAAGAPAFGAPPPGGPVAAFIGLAPMRNVTGDDWPVWYAEHRVLPYLRRAVDEGTMDPGEADVVERICARLPDLAGPAEPPARLHGDLWNGNVLWGRGRQGAGHRPGRARRAPGDRPGDAGAVRLPAAGRRPGGLPGRGAARRGLAGTRRRAPAVPAAGARRAVRPGLRRAGARRRPVPPCRRERQRVTTCRSSGTQWVMVSPVTSRGGCRRGWRAACGPPR